MRAQGGDPLQEVDRPLQECTSRGSRREFTAARRCARNREHMSPSLQGKPDASVLVGCAGWSLPSSCAAHFADGDSALQRYASRFPVVEINSSFYRLHQASTYARWASVVPAGFRFSVKMPQTISHVAGLRGTASVLDPFLDGVQHLGDRLGALLLQLPPRLEYEGRVASALFRALRRRTHVPVACEPRHASWFSAAADALLRAHGIARVAADPARTPGGAVPAGAQNWSYWRLHGHPRVYYSAYEEPALQQLAADAMAHAGSDAPTWVIFDNTAQGHAVPNALRLQALLQERADA